VAKTEKLLAKMRESPTNITYNELYSVCVHYFGEPRQNGTSHANFKMPWPGDPRVNIQSKNGKAKPYQVKQALEAIDKFDARKEDA
jgi:hypothetical protein